MGGRGFVSYPPRGMQHLLYQLVAFCHCLCAISSVTVATMLVDPVFFGPCSEAHFPLVLGSVFMAGLPIVCPRGARGVNLYSVLAAVFSPMEWVIFLGSGFWCSDRVLWCPCLVLAVHPCQLCVCIAGQGSQPVISSL